MRSNALIGRLRRVAGALALTVVLLTGCSVVEVHSYTDPKMEVRREGAPRVCVVTVDMRPYIVSGDFPPSFTGIVHGFWGNANAVLTASGQPLAEEMSRAVAGGLRREGLDPVILTVPAGTSPDVIQRRLQECGAERTVTLRVNEWKTRTWMRTSATYDLDWYFRETTPTGKQEASHEHSGRENLGGNLGDPRGYARVAVQRFFKRTIDEALADPNVKRVLE
ncbi:MAG TPA: hypothetical protein PLS90_12875 [Candidatus Sumerlaeota bacterium]|nr:hypothetical protein [Candidatus Sumerlaeota bacterium]HPK03340.1 hypothetical protein [Candidatus Sumerlaeota bacterium]